MGHVNSHSKFRQLTGRCKFLETIYAMSSGKPGLLEDRILFNLGTLQLPGTSHLVTWSGFSGELHTSQSENLDSLLVDHDCLFVCWPGF